MNTQRRLVILQPGEKLASLAAVPGDFADWILAGMGYPAGSGVLVVRPHAGEPLPAPGEVAAAVVTGSSAMVDDGHDWIEPCAHWLRELLALGRPVLGICFGHQLLAHALGGEVRENPNGIEVGTVRTHLTDAAPADPLFGGLATVIPVQASHRQCVITLPPGAVRLAASDMDLNHAFRFGSNAWGLQFHPEFDREITRAYIERYRPDLEASGRPVERMLGETAETVEPGGLLRRFGRELQADSSGLTANSLGDRSADQ